jgi:hypothetical protein
LLTAKIASSRETPLGGAVVVVAKNMKIISLGWRAKERPIVIKTAFFRGKMKNRRASNSQCRV